MRAGQLSRLQAVAVTMTESVSKITGARSVSEEEGKTFHFFRQTFKEQAALLGKDEAQKGVMVLQVRKSPTTRSMTHFRFEGQLYRIDSKIPDVGSCRYNITATLVNE